MLSIQAWWCTKSLRLIVCRPPQGFSVYTHMIIRWKILKTAFRIVSKAYGAGCLFLQFGHQCMWKMWEMGGGSLVFCFFSLFRCLLQFLFFYCIHILLCGSHYCCWYCWRWWCCCQCAAFLSYILHHFDSLVRDILLCSCSCRRLRCDVES